MWWVILVCAAGVSCGIENPIAKQVGATSVEHCRQVGHLTLDLAGYDRSKFKIVCAKSDE